MKRVQWFPGHYVEGVTEIFHDPGDGSTKSNWYAVCGDEIVKPGDWIVTDANGVARRETAPADESRE